MLFATIDLPRGRKHKNPSAFTNCDYKKWLLLICDHCKKGKFAENLNEVNKDIELLLHSKHRDVSNT